jgi:adenylate cyclase
MERTRLENQLELQLPADKMYLFNHHARNGNAKMPSVEAGEVSPKSSPAVLPKVRFPVWVKITLPYVLLALVVALAGAYIVSRVVLDSIEERFANQLIEAGALAADHIVQEETRLLETWRLLAHTQGLAEAVIQGQAEELHRLTLPVVANAQEEAIEILDVEGIALLSLHHLPGTPPEDYTASQGDRTFARLLFVQQVLETQVDETGDKFAGLAQVAEVEYFYVAGPLVDEQGELVGVLMVGKSLPTLVRQIRQATLAHATVYDLDGQRVASTLPPLAEDNYLLAELQVKEVLAQAEAYSGIRDLTVGSIDYSEIIGPWEIRDGQRQGLMGIALPQTFLVYTSQFTRFQIFFLVTLTFLLITVVGVVLANRITHPLLRIVEASAEVAQGNLKVQVEPVGRDEVAVLSHAFNQMVSGLREGSLYRDLLGRSVSPEVREELRQTFSSGTVQLEGQNALATVLISDIRDFTVLSEKIDPATVLNWLNEYFGELVPIIAAQGGVINGFQGDALLAFFGILPRPLSVQESAYHACQAAIGMLEAIERINARRSQRGEPPFITGIGINTGIVTAGGLGSTDRLHYTVIGDTVNTTQRLENLTRQLGGSGVIISQHTWLALRKLPVKFKLELLGVKPLKGKSEALPVYRLHPSTEVVALTEAMSS